jgi:hypothetical protein
MLNGGIMKSSILIVGLLLAVTVTSVPQVRAQEDMWNIVTVSGDTLWECKLVSLFDSTLNVERSGIGFETPVESIVALVSPNPSGTWIGKVVGGLAGATAGALIGSGMAEDEKRGFGPDPRMIPAIVGGAIGAIVGSGAGAAIESLSSRQKAYDLHGKTTDQKVQIIRDVRAENE